MREDLIAEARSALAQADSVAATYGDTVVFPEQLVVDRSPDFTYFPGWKEGDVLVLSHENQGVVTWGLSLEGATAGAVVVGGDLRGGEGTKVHANTVEDFVRSRMWDAECFRAPLLQAQANPAKEDELAVIVAGWSVGIATHGWPCDRNLRFEKGGMRLMAWLCADQTDWWVSGPPDELEQLIPALRTASDLAEALWSNDAVGEQLLGNEGRP